MEPITDDLAWTVSEPEPQFVNGSFSGYTFCVQSAWSDCTVEINTELGIGPNGAYLFEAVAEPAGALFSDFCGLEKRPRVATLRDAVFFPLECSWGSTPGPLRRPNGEP